MEYINRNDELLSNSYSEGYYILDSKITRFDIYSESDKVYIDVYFSLPFNRFKNEKNLKLHFIGVTEYEFYWNNQYNFYTIERFKFFKADKGYFISFDPYDDSGDISDNDHDFILCDEVAGYFI